MKDYGLLIIKPEVIDKKDEIIAYLARLGYTVLKKQLCDNWREFSIKIYREFHSDDIAAYMKGYDRHGFGNQFLVLLLHHPRGDTLQRLKGDQGHFLDYQKNHDTTLRSKFGLSDRYNIPYVGRTQNYVFTYSGIHVPTNKEELKYHLILLGLKIT